MLRGRRGRDRHREKREQGPQGAARVILNGLGKDAAQIISRINGFYLCSDTVRLLHRRDKVVREIAYSKASGRRCAVTERMDVREGVAIMHLEGVDVSITGNSTNPTRISAPCRGT
jgi:hypothetical protein